MDTAATKCYSGSSIIYRSEQMRPKTNEDFHRISLSLDARLLQRLQAWRASQLVEPPLTSSIRRLLELALDHVGQPPIGKTAAKSRGKRGDHAR
jgi:hypothetical protein